MGKRGSTCTYCGSQYRILGKHTVAQCKNQNCGAVFDSSRYPDEVYQHYKKVPEQDTVRDIGV